MAENVWLLANVMIGFDSHTKLRTDSRRSGWLHQTNRPINQRGCWNILTVCIYCFGQVIGVSSQIVDSTSIRRGFCQCAGHKLPLQLRGGEARQESVQSVEVLFFFLAARRTRFTMTRATLARTTSSTSTTLELFVKQRCQRRHRCLHFIFNHRWLIYFHHRHWVEWIGILFSDNWTITDQLIDKWTAHKSLQCQETSHWRNNMWIVCRFCVILLWWVGLVIVFQLGVVRCANCHETSVINGQWSIVMIDWTWTWTLTWTDMDGRPCDETGF